jgi:cyanophycinase
MKILLTIFQFFLLTIGFAGNIPGKLLIVGGGSEQTNGWSNSPYSWAVEQSENKRVAIISYDSDPGNWLPNYFKNLGALEAKNFIIPNITVANAQETYDSLITYHVIFFKGGDQWKYYQYYKNTLTLQAVEDVFNDGGVICGTSAGLAILSEVIYTAENGSVYSEEALEDPFNNYMTLENDFLQLFTGYIFDSHFVERARFGRLIGFLGNWEISQEESIVGIGVDDKTAFCIDSNLMGHAFGTGAVNIYRANAGNDFRISGEKLLANAIDVKQLLNECTINLNTFEVNGLSTWSQPEFEAFAFHNNLWLSGSDKIYDNTLLLEKFTQDLSSQDTVLIITGINTSLAGFYQDYIMADLGKQVLVFQALQSNVDNPLWKSRIENLEYFVFLGNDYETLMDFLGTWPNGNLMKDLVKAGEKQVVFIGDNSRFAGKTVLVNYEQEYASYDGLLDFGPGLGLLRNAIIMPKAFANDIDNENAAAGVPFGMILDELKYGIWLYEDCFLHYKPENNFVNITSQGKFPMIWMENSDGTWGDFSTESAVSSGEPRDVAGFDGFTLSLLDSTITKQYDLVETVSESIESSFRVFPNPAKDVLYILNNSEKKLNITIYDLQGKKVLERKNHTGNRLNISFLQPGSYLIYIKDNSNRSSQSTKLVIQ